MRNLALESTETVDGKWHSRPMFGRLPFNYCASEATWRENRPSASLGHGDSKLWSIGLDVGDLVSGGRKLATLTGANRIPPGAPTSQELELDILAPHYGGVR